MSPASFRLARGRVGGHEDRPEPHEGEPGEEVPGGVAHRDEDEVAAADAEVGEPGGHGADPAPGLLVGEGGVLGEQPGASAAASTAPASRFGMVRSIGDIEEPEGSLRAMIRTEERGRVAILRIDRHEQRNALDTEHCELLRDALGDVQAAGARAVVVTGEGSSFCAGADFGEVYGEGFRKALYEMLRRFTASPVPIIAAVNGPAIGAGTQLALAADLRTVAPGRHLRHSHRHPRAGRRPLDDPAPGAAGRRRQRPADPPGLRAAVGRRGPGLRAGRRRRRPRRRPGAGGPHRRPGAAHAGLLQAGPEPAPGAGDRDPGLDSLFEEVWRSADVAEGQAARRERRPPRFEGR